MATNTVNIDVLINTSKSAKSLAEQREALKSLREGLDSVKQGSGAFELLSEEVTRLTNDMGLLNLTFEDAYGEIKPLTSQIGELEDRLYQMAIAGQQNSKEFKDLTAEAARLKLAVKDVDDNVDSLSQRGR
jgi:chromosome segregation ATPase